MYISCDHALAVGTSQIEVKLRYVYLLCNQCTFSEDKVGIEPLYTSRGNVINYLFCDAQGINLNRLQNINVNITVIAIHVVETPLNHNTRGANKL